MKYRFGGTLERYITENTESQALRPSAGSSPHPPWAAAAPPAPVRGGPRPPPPPAGSLPAVPAEGRGARAVPTDLPAAAAPAQGRGGRGWPRPLSRVPSARAARTRTALSSPACSDPSAPASARPSRLPQRSPSGEGPAEPGALSVQRPPFRCPQRLSAGLELNSRIGTTSAPPAEAHSVSTRARASWRNAFEGPRAGHAGSCSLLAAGPPAAQGPRHAPRRDHALSPLAANGRARGGAGRRGARAGGGARSWLLRAGAAVAAPSREQRPSRGPAAAGAGTGAGTGTRTGTGARAHTEPPGRSRHLPAGGAAGLGEPLPGEGRDGGGRWRSAFLSGAAGGAQPPPPARHSLPSGPPGSPRSRWQRRPQSPPGAAAAPGPPRGRAAPSPPVAARGPGRSPAAPGASRARSAAGSERRGPALLPGCAASALTPSRNFPG